jgi:RNA polymerase sigma factor (sigma-70 family)
LRYKVLSRFRSHGVLEVNAAVDRRMKELGDLVTRAQNGDLEAFGRLIAATQAMAYAVARGVLRDHGMAEDAAQDAYLRAFRNLRDLDEPAAFVAWLRRIVITVALNMRRAHRVSWLQLEDIPDVPVLDEAETSWSELQRRRLATALLTLSRDERQLCDRRYHGQWSVTRLAAAAGVPEPVMRKRLQRVRDKLRKEIEVSEQRGIHPDEIRSDFPAKVVELLARPKLTDLPENPVGTVLELLRTVYAGFQSIDLAEILDFEEARKSIGDDALYVEPGELHRLDDRPSCATTSRFRYSSACATKGGRSESWPPARRTASARSMRCTSMPSIRQKYFASMSGAALIRGR